MIAPRLTGHQADTLRRIARQAAHRGQARSGWVGCPGACATLEQKGYITRQPVRGRRGGTSYLYTLTEQGRRAVRRRS